MRTDKHEVKAILENAFVLLVDQEVVKVQNIIPILEQVVKKQESLLVTVKSIEEEVLSTLVVNNIKEQLTSIGVEVPLSAEEREGCSKTLQS